MIIWSKSIIICLLLLLEFATLSSTAELKLPSCDSARKNYKNGKLYDVLGVKKTSSDAEIRKAFKKMSIKCHPDKDRENPEANNNFIAITGAYETLSDEKERQNYDMFGSSGSGSGSSSNGAGGHHQWRAKNYEDINVNDIFSKFSGGNFKFSFGGSGDSDDSIFEQLFQNFNFDNFRQQGRQQGRQQQQPRQQQHTFGFGDVFDGLGNMFGGASQGFNGFGFGGSQSQGQGQAKPNQGFPRHSHQSGFGPSSSSSSSSKSSTTQQKAKATKPQSQSQSQPKKTVFEKENSNLKMKQSSSNTQSSTKEYSSSYSMVNNKRARK